MTPTDAELVQRALAGSQAAYQGLVSRYAAPAVNLATRMVHDRALAEDLAQEAFVRAFDRLSTYDQQRRFASWFFQILHNVVVDFLRLKRPTMISLDDAEEAAHQVIPASSAVRAPDAHVEEVELARAIDKALGLLRPEYQEVVVLYYREELSIEEVAAALKLPPGTVKAYLFRARKELASILAARGWANTPIGKS